MDKISGKEISFGRRSPLIDPKNNRLYLNSAKQVVCLDSTTGEQKWQREFESDMDNLFTGHIALYNGNIVFGNSNSLWCLSKEDGETIWRSGVIVTSNIEIALNRVCFGSYDDICRIDATTGKTISVVNVPDKDSYNFINFIDKNKVVASTSRGMKKLIDLRKGAVIWESNKNITKLLDKPLINGKKLVVFGYMVGS